MIRYRSFKIADSTSLLCFFNIPVYSLLMSSKVNKLKENFNHPVIPLFTFLELQEIL